MLPHPPRGLVALILLHEVLLVVLGVVALLSALSDAIIENNVQTKTGLYLLFGSVALLCGWGFFAAVKRHPLRNRQALLGIIALGTVSLGGLAASLPLVFYRIRTTPLGAWLCLVPTGALLWLAGRHLRYLSRAHVGAPGILEPDPHHHAPREHSAPPASPPSTIP